MALEEQIMDYATQKFSTETPEQTPPAEIVADTPESPAEQPPAEIATVIPETQTPTIDHGKIFTEVLGEETDVETVKSIYQKGKEYDTVLTQKAELEEKLKSSEPVNEYVKTINDMIKSGKSMEEIDNFHKLSKVDVATLSPIEAKVMVMVKKGYNEEIARDIVKEEYPLEEYEEGTPERRRIEEKLRVSSEEDKKELAAWKKEVSHIDTTASEQAEQQRLEGIAREQDRIKLIKGQAPAIAEKFTGLGERVLNGKEGDEAIKLNFDYAPEYKAELPARIENFFKDANLEVNEDNIAQAERYVRADYLEKNIDTIMQDVFKHAVSLTEERMVQKYENRSGLPPDATVIPQDNIIQQKSDFLTRIANGQRID
jgi:hypothetical protein